MKIIRRTTPAFRKIEHQGPTRASLASRWPTKRAIGAACHFLLGSDNPSDTCLVTGKRLHPNFRGYVSDGGSGYTVAPTITLPNGAVANAILTSSVALTPTKVSGGSGYSSAPTVNVSATVAPGGWLPRYSAIMSAGTVNALAVLDSGFGLLSDPVISFVGGGGTGANFTTALTRSVKAITVTAGGSGYTGAPSVSVSGGVSGSNTIARAVAVISGGAVTQVLMLDGGFGYTSAPTISFSGGGGTGATATATIGTNCVRAIEVTECGSQTGSVAATITGGDGTGAAGGALMASGTYTRSASFLTIPAGGTTDVTAQNGMLLPILDSAEFTVLAVVKKTTAGTSQVIMGTASNGGASYGGFDIKNSIGTGYQVTDFNLQLTASTLTSPGASGDWIVVVYSVTPVAGESVQPSSAVLQSHKLYARVGLQTALSVTSGERRALHMRKLVGIGNTQQVSVSFRGALDVAEVIGYQRALTTSEIEAEIAAIVTRQAARGNTVVT